MYSLLSPTTRTLFGLGVAMALLSGCVHAPMFNSPTQRDCMERALQGSATAEDARLARQLLERACALEDASACGVLGVLHEYGRDGRVDLARSEKAYDRACTLGDTRGCAHTSRLLMRSTDPAQVRDSARALERYCEMGEVVACVALAADLPASGSSPALAGKAMGLLWRACDLGDASACLGIGDRLHEQPEQEAVAMEHWLRACALGSEAACVRHLARPSPLAVVDVD